MAVYKIEEQSDYPYALFVVNSIDVKCFLLYNIINEKGMFDTTSFSHQDFLKTIEFFYRFVGNLEESSYMNYKKIHESLIRFEKTQSDWRFIPEKADNYSYNFGTLVLTFKSKLDADRYKLLLDLGPEYNILE